MISVHRGARAAIIFVASILFFGFLLAGMAAAFQEEPLAPLICPFPAAPAGIKLAAWINGVAVASTTTQASCGVIGCED